MKRIIWAVAAMALVVGCAKKNTDTAANTQADTTAPASADDNSHPGPPAGFGPPAGVRPGSADNSTGQNGGATSAQGNTANEGPGRMGMGMGSEMGGMHSGTPNTPQQGRPPQ